MIVSQQVQLQVQLRGRQVQAEAQDAKIALVAAQVAQLHETNLKMQAQMAGLLARHSVAAQTS